MQVFDLLNGREPVAFGTVHASASRMESRLSGAKFDEHGKWIPPSKLVTRYVGVMKSRGQLVWTCDSWSFMKRAQTQN